MATNVLQGNTTVTGMLAAASTSFDGAITNSDINAVAAIEYTKMGHLHKKTFGLSGTVAATTVPVACIYGATGEVLSVKAGNVTAETGANSWTADVQKDGATVLAAVITLDNANVAFTPEAGTLVTSGVEDLVAGDVLTVVIALGGASDATGAYVTVVWSEDAAP